MIINIVNYFTLLISMLGINMNIFDNNVFSYEAHLTIPKIGLSQFIYDKEDVRSDLEKNLIFVDDSDTPLINNGNVIIAGHSGSTTVSYFKNLYKLRIGDIIYLEYDDYVYKYEVDYKYLVMKNGNVEIIRDNNKESLTLITCYGNDKQLVVISNKIGQTKK